MQPASATDTVVPLGRGSKSVVAREPLQVRACEQAHTQGRGARDQFAALLAASHPRCGAGSPARLLAEQQPATLRLLWKSYASRAQRFVVEVATAGRGAVPSCVTFGVSRLTLGSTSPAAPVAWSADRILWVGPAACIEEKQHSWYCDYTLCDYETGQNNTAVTARVAVPNGVLSVSYFFFCKCKCGRTDQAVLCYNSDGRTTLLVVDIPRTFTSSTLAVVESVRCGISFTIYGGLCLRKSTGASAFIFQSIDLSAENALLSQSTLEVTPIGAVLEIASGRDCLSQLSDSLFCLSNRKHASSYEIWDCNDTHKPLLVVETNGRCQAIASYGFIFNLSSSSDNSHTMTVTEFSSGIAVMTFHFSSALVGVGIENVISFYD
ncbi:hypothetical protein Pelo_3923 [Pelomyxa schiedti]|nr:hypothetical protein Pelo_3923 [Pelomyxa schiedti]